MNPKNVLGTALLPCSYDPVTGYFRDGCCNTDEFDLGAHLVCVRVTQAFLTFSRSCGNDLMTPKPEYRFAGLKAGQRWCLCVNRWRESLEAGCAPPVILESTHVKALEFVTMAQLEKHRFQGAEH
ncbi:MAG: DUF2237 domain-containing protein [Polaromonas sp.]|uniref:DUF2237 family protein n=1 Tax=Polaromonas sp. TaxID=1869339 RepID=UPI00272F1FC3|nr:DUF2237 domain-containing protein [Polaromonas sp.]MDP2254640.1 DUF2237 domain-containing protein [Polaromonas sp.]